MRIGYVSDERYVALADVAIEFIDARGGSWETRSRASGSIHAELPAGELQSLLTQHDSPIGRLTHLAPVVQMSETPARWSRPAVQRGFHQPVWPERG